MPSARLNPSSPTPLASLAHVQRRGPRVGLRAAVVLAALFALALGAWWPATAARADGDPASDVLATQDLFLPQDAGATPGEQAQLGALLQAAHHTGYQIRVALIASPSDLGSVTELWRSPESYARFLGQELSLVYRGGVLVIMPGGIGFSRLQPPLAGKPTTLAGVVAPPSAAGLAPVAITAVRRLAAASGIDLPLPRATAPTGGGPTDTLALIAFAIGCAAIVAAWSASVRARPLGRRVGELPGE